MGDRNFLALRFRDEVRSAPEQAPELLVAGPPITTPGGHCHFLGGVAAGIPALRAAVRERYERGCDVIKVMASGGDMTPNSAPYESQYNLDELTAMVEEARMGSDYVVAHVHAASAVVDALAAGVAGFDADLLAVEGDPLEGINRLLDVRAVFRAGTRVR